MVEAGAEVSSGLLENAVRSTLSIPLLQQPIISWQPRQHPPYTSKHLKQSRKQQFNHLILTVVDKEMDFAVSP
jgi:hypothetical protein